MMLGGLLWILNYVVQIVIGVTLGAETYSQADPRDSALVWLWGVFFMGAVFFVGIGLLGVRARLQGRAKILGLLGALLGSVAIAAVSINLVMLTGISGEPTASDDLGFLGVIGTLGGSVLLGIATLRAKVLPRWARFTLTLLPLAFIPAIIATFPLESVLPEYVASDLPFPVVGAVLATVGYAMLRDGRSEAANRRGLSREFHPPSPVGLGENTKEV
jgi:uncharacterized membrane protein